MKESLESSIYSLDCILKRISEERMEAFPNFVDPRVDLSAVVKR